MTAVVTAPVRTAGTAVRRARRRSVERMRLLLISLSLVLAVFGQSAGNTATDTKFDLVISPLRFLGRALKLWDPIGNGGQLQNQSYGYLFPIGPFFAVLHGLGLPPWELQRAWESAIVVAAFLGAYRLARRIGINAFWPAVVTGLAYALAPRTLSELTSISSELMPVAALPWILLPLATGARQGSARRAAGRSGIALLFAGGVNAAATLAVLPAPALFLLTRERGPRRRSLMTWWVVAVALASLWWAIPLLLLGRYSPPFLDWIESSSTTTLPTSLLASLRGADHWESYLGPNVWPAGWIFASAPMTVIATSAVAGLGLTGLARRDVPQRRFLWATLLLGLVLLTFGHVGDVAAPGADTFRRLLDGPLVAFRNVHKFDPLLRLPLALGLGHLLVRIRIPARVRLGRRPDASTVPARPLAVLAGLAVALIAVAPVLTNHLVSSQRITAEPGWWRSAGDWLAKHSDGARALVVPGSSSPQYLWGGTVDNALQPVATTPWAERNAVPLAQAGFIRLLDQVESELAGGVADPSLAPLLARAGIGYVVLANDMDTLQSGSTPLLFVRSTLRASPGLTLAADLGPKFGGTLSSKILLDSGATVPQPAVQIYRVDAWPGRASLEPTAGAVTGTGSSDALAQLVERGLPSSTPTFLGADADRAPKGSIDVTTDGIRRREASFAGILQPSVTLDRAARYAVQRPVHDYLPAHPGPLSAYEYVGLAGVRASSAGDAPLAYVNRGDLNGAWSAFDGDPSTSWKSTGFSGGAGQWIEADLTRPEAPSSVTVAFADVQAPLPTEVVVSTDAGSATERVRPTTAPQTLTLPAGSTRSIRIGFTAFAGDAPAGSVGVTSFDIPGVDAGRTLVVPSRPRPQVLAFDAADGYRAACLDTGTGTGTGFVCDASYARSGQEDAAVDRTFTLGGDGNWAPTATVRFRGGTALDEMLDAGSPIRASASSVYSTDPRLRPGAAVDGDPRTAWQAGAGDQHPTLTLTLPTPKSISGLTVTTPVSVPVASALRVTVTAGDQRWSGRLPADGHVALPAAVTTRRVTLRVDEASLRPTTSSVSLGSRLLPVGIGEVALDGVPNATTTAAAELHLGCTAGAGLDVDGNRVPLQVSTTRGAVLRGAPVAAQPCDATPLHLSAGRHRVLLPATSLTAPVGITLARAHAGRSADLTSSAPPAGAFRIRSWGADDRRVSVHARSAAVFVVRENANAGWRATLDGHRLRSITVDGWEQGYLVPAGSSGVLHLTYAPQRSFAWGLVVGALAVLALLVAAAWPGRDAHPPIGASRRNARVAALGVVAAFVLLGSWPAVLVLLAVAAATRLVTRSWVAVPGWVSATLLVAAAVSVVQGQRSLIFAHQNGSLAQLLCIGALAAAVLAASRRPRQGREP